MREMINVMIPMRDGVKLACNIFRPDDEAAYPAILMRTPYIKEKFTPGDIFADYEKLAMAGYNVVFQDVRGTGHSQGMLHATGISEPDDGYDTIEWIAAQPWCDGNVGTQGLSYFGYVQMAAAGENPPHLKAICPFQNGALLPFSFSAAGTFQNYHLMWVYSQALENLETWCPDPVIRQNAERELKKYRESWNAESFKLPVIDTPAARIEGVPQLSSYIDLINSVEDPDGLKKLRRPINVAGIEAPMFMLSGWFDGALGGTLDNWAAACERPFERGTRKLIIGPWGHGGMLNTNIDGLDFGEQNSGQSVGIPETMKRWFDYWLKGEENGLENESPVRVFVLGSNVWRDENEWPPQRAVETSFYLHGGADKNRGILNAIKPEDEAAQQYVYDPENPLPSSYADEKGRTVFADAGVQDNRDDVLVFTSEALKHDVEAAGAVKLKLYAATTAVDTDFYCRLSDVDETGYAFPLTAGIVRGRFRNQLLNAELLEPNKVYEFSINVGHICNVFKKGHRIKLQISSSCYPEHDRNLNTADRIGYGDHSITATQTIYHDAEHPSRLILPII